MPTNESGNVSLDLLRRQLASLTDKQRSGLKGGGGDGTFSDMEARVKRLEEDSKEMRADLKAIRIDLAEIKGKVSAMPSTWQMVGLIVAMAIAIFTVVRVALPI